MPADDYYKYGGLTKIQFQEKQKRKRNRLKRYGLQRRKGFKPYKYEPIGPPVWKPMFGIGGQISFTRIISSLFLLPWWLRRRSREQREKRFEKP